VTAQLSHGNLKRYTRPSGSLLENHSQRFVFESGSTRSWFPFDLDRLVNHIGYLRRSKRGRALKLDTNLEAFFAGGPATGCAHLPGLPLPSRSAAWIVMGSLPLFGLGIGLLLSLWMSRSVTRPVSQLAQATQAVGKRDLGYRVITKGSQELQDLAQSFNRMAEDLEHAELTRHNLMADIANPAPPPPELEIPGRAQSQAAS
jgi:methyl-accepting chemotaxis protein